MFYRKFPKRAGAAKRCGRGDASLRAGLGQRDHATATGCRVRRIQVEMSQMTRFGSWMEFGRLFFSRFLAVDILVTRCLFAASSEHSGCSHVCSGTLICVQIFAGVFACELEIMESVLWC